MSCALGLEGFYCKRGDALILEDVSLHLGHKEKMVLLGTNGSGKSTFLKSLAGLHPHCGGGMEIFHKKIKEASEFKSVKFDIAMLFQNSEDQFVASRVLDDVAFTLLVRGVPKEEAKARAMETLQFFGIEQLAEKEVFFISGGEQRLVALASLLVGDPKLLLLDEPTNGLDEEVSDRIIEYLKTIDKSMIIATHDKDFVEKLGFSQYKIVEKNIRSI